MFYAYNAKKKLYRFGSNDRKITEAAVAKNLAEEIRDWDIIETKEDLVLVNKKLFPKSKIPSEEIIAEKADKIRQIRNVSLSQSDWTQMPDNALSETQREKWKTYRQTLRDITLQPDFPNKITFPPTP